MIGKLRHRITIQIPVKSINDWGEEVETFQDWQTVWASIEPLRGRRYFEAKQANSEVTGIVRTRYLKGIEPNMRIKHGNRYLQIISVVCPEEKRKQLDIYYKEALD